MRQPKCYEYEPGRFIAHVRESGGHTLGVSIPKSIAQTYRLRPGMKVMLEIKPVKEQQEGGSDGERMA